MDGWITNTTSNKSQTIAQMNSVKHSKNKLCQLARFLALVIGRASHILNMQFRLQTNILLKELPTHLEMLFECKWIAEKGYLKAFRIVHRCT